MRKLHRVLDTRNEVDHLGEYLNERRNGLVECIELYVIQRCGMSTHNYLPFVRGLVQMLLVWNVLGMMKIL